MISHQGESIEVELATVVERSCGCFCQMKNLFGSDILDHKVFPVLGHVHQRGDGDQPDLGATAVTVIITATTAPRRSYRGEFRESGVIFQARTIITEVHDKDTSCLLRDYVQQISDLSDTSNAQTTGRRGGVGPEFDAA